MSKGLFVRLTILVISCGVLVACAETRRFEKKYDEFTKQSICRVDLPGIAHGWGKYAGLLIEKPEKKNNIKAVIVSTDVVAGLWAKNKNFSNNPDVTFDIFTNGNAKQFAFKAQTVDTKKWEQCTGSGLNYQCADYRSASNLIPITKEQIKSIANADSVVLTISSKEGSLQGKLNQKEIQLLRQFCSECLESSHE